MLKELTSPASFQWNVRESYSAIAKKIGVDEETVRIAVKRARDSGFVENWRIFLNPRTVGFIAAAVQLERGIASPGAKSKAISQIKLIDGVVIIFDFHGRALRMVFVYETTEQMNRKLALLNSLCRCKDAMLWKTAAESDLPSPRFAPKQADWRILKAISKDPRRNAAEVAEEVRLSTRTVNRRLKAMTEGKMFYLIPVRNVKKSKGLLCNFVILCSEHVKKDIEKLMEKTRIDFVYPARKGIYNATILFDNISDADELAEEIRTLPGITDLRMNIMKEFIYVDSWLDEVLSKKLSEGVLP